jgi:hypothetical protein
MDTTREIPEEQWSTYLDTLTREAQSQCVRIEIDDASLGDQPLGQHLPLVEIGLERKGAAHGSIEITLGTPDGEITHRTPPPRHLYAVEGSNGRVAVLDVEDGEGAKTLIYFE